LNLPNVGSGTFAEAAVEFFNLLCSLLNSADPMLAVTKILSPLAF
jgi:hypothetical protein